MLGRLKNYITTLPYLYFLLRKIKGIFSNSPDLSTWQTPKQEIIQIKKVFYSGLWNSSYSSTGMHSELEKKFAGYVGVEYALAVNTGGMALQMIFRALGLKPGDEIIHQVDTCVATPYAVMNAFCTPVFTDIDLNSNMLNITEVEKYITQRTKAILPVHMWGNAENMDKLQEVASKNNIAIVEDSCLALGAEWKDKKVGTFGVASAFSFGCSKPLQVGEGGMVVTNDPHLLKELKMLRDWGETTKVLGYRDQIQLAWNGRISEFVAAVALAQLQKYPSHLEKVRENVISFATRIRHLPGITLLNNPEKSAHTQVVLRLDYPAFPFPKKEFFDRLKAKNIFAWHANFEPVNTLSFFSKHIWKNWVLQGDIDFIEKNYGREFVHANYLYEKTGIGLNKAYFLRKKNVNYLIDAIESSVLSR